MSQDKSYRSLAEIQEIGEKQTAQRPLVESEYRNYDDYIRAQKQVHEHMFRQPAVTCELCGYAMDYNNHKLTEWEEKWSIHTVCKKKLDGMLDRETGIARERKNIEKQKERRMQRENRKMGRR